MTHRHRSQSACISQIVAICSCLTLTVGCSESEPPDTPGIPIGADLNDWPTLTSGVTLRDTQNLGNATGIHQCEGGQYSHYEAPENGTQLHVIGVYEPGAGPIEVHVTRPGTSILWLSSYEPTRWMVTAGPDTTIERVLVSGLGTPIAEVPADTILEVFGNQLGPIGFVWPSYDATNLVELAEFYLDQDVTSFRGCYRAQRFEIATPGPIRPPNPVSTATEPNPLPGCNAIVNESNYCMAMAGLGGGSATMIGLDSGLSCGGLAIPVAMAGSATMGWSGDYVYTCAYDRGLVRTSVVDGSVDVAPVPCEAVTTYDGGLLTLAPLESFTDKPMSSAFGLVEFASFADAAQRLAAHVYELDPFASRLAVNGERAYFAWHSTDAVESALLMDGAAISTIPLQGYDDWIQALEVLDDGRMLIGAPWHLNIDLFVFDTETGEQLGTIDIVGVSDISGLSCVSNPASES